METGSILMLGNGLTQPMAMGWKPIAQDVACTVWRKQCVCAGAEDFLVAPTEEVTVPIVCTRCGRDIEIP